MESIPIAILAGGLGTRLGHLTASTPKAMLPVNGRPFLAHQIEYLRQQGLRRIVICAGHLGSKIADYFGNQLEYSFDGDKQLGTAGALRNALPLLGDRFLAIYGDSYLPTNVQAVWNAFTHSGATALMTVFRNEGRFDRSNILFENGRILAHDKSGGIPAMQHIDYGLSAFRADAFQHGNDDLSGLFCDLLQRGRLAGFEVGERFYQIGSTAGLAEFTHDFQ